MLPMTQPLREILIDRAKLKRNELVIPSTRTKGVIKNLRTDLDKIAERTGTHLIIHALRRTYITIAEGLDIPD